MYKQGLCRNFFSKRGENVHTVQGVVDQIQSEIHECEHTEHNGAAFDGTNDLPGDFSAVLFFTNYFRNLFLSGENIILCQLAVYAG